MDNFREQSLDVNNLSANSGNVTLKLWIIGAYHGGLVEVHKAVGRGVDALTYIVRYPVMLVHIGLNNGKNKQAMLLDSPVIFRND